MESVDIFEKEVIGVVMEWTDLKVLNHPSICQRQLDVRDFQQINYPILMGWASCPP
jgi:hypothetical protein